MDRRLFLTGMLGLAGAAAVASVVRPGSAEAGIPNSRGILDELDGPGEDVFDDGAALTQVNHRHGHWGHHHRPRHRRRRRVWRRVCRRYWRHGRYRVRCRRERVWVWGW